VPLRYAPGFSGHAYTIDADVIVPPDGAEGVILADGGELGGLSLFVKNNHVYYEVNVSNDHSDQFVATQTLRPGLQHIELVVTPDPAAVSASPSAGSPGSSGRAPVSGSVRLSINGAPAGQSQFSSVYAAGETFDVGSYLGSPVSLEYRSPYRFTGEIEKVTVQLK
jgi:arylsulfatase